jgi:hypothetical protein
MYSSGSGQIGQANVLFSLSYHNRSLKVNWHVAKAGQMSMTAQHAGAKADTQACSQVAKVQSLQN